MINTLISDFSRVLLFPTNSSYSGGLNALNKELMEKYGPDYEFFQYFKLNLELLDYYEKIQHRLPVYIFTSETIQDRPEVRKIIDPVFTDVFSAKTLGVSKKESKSYLLLTEKLNKKPNEIIYIDDQALNITAAMSAGLTTIHYISFSDTKAKLNNYLK